MGRISLSPGGSGANKAQYYLADDGVTLVPIEGVGGAAKVSESDKPADRKFEGYFFGTDDTEATVVVNVLTDGTWLDMSDISPSARSITIINGNANPSYTYNVLFGRKINDPEARIVKTESLVTEQYKDVAIPSGYDKFVMVQVHADAGQAGTQLEFKVPISGRGAA